jgi:RNA polymerase sigma-70 factor (ECF subfamily)
MGQRNQPAPPESDGGINDGNTKSLTEKELVQRAQNGDVKAFEHLYRGHVGRVFALCLRMSGETGRAEELTQDVFLRTWEKLRSFRGESAFSSWLHRLAVNLVLGEKRSRTGKMERISVADPAPQDREAARPSKPWNRIDLEKAIASLPPGARTVFVLHDVEGYGHEEIAELTGMAPGTSKAQLHWARKALRERLGS